MGEDKPVTQDELKRELTLYCVLLNRTPGARDPSGPVATTVRMMRDWIVRCSGEHDSDKSKAEILDSLYEALDEWIDSYEEATQQAENVAQAVYGD